MAGEPRARAPRSTSRIGLPLRGVANAPISMRWHTQHRPWNSRRNCGNITRFHLHPASSGHVASPWRVADVDDQPRGIHTAESRAARKKASPKLSDASILRTAGHPDKAITNFLELLRGGTPQGHWATAIDLGQSCCRRSSVGSGLMAGVG